MRKAALLALALACHAVRYAPTPAPTIGHPVRLVGGGSEREGLVEILHDGQWGTVCDDGWGIEDATVVCQQLFGVDASEAPRDAFFGQGDGKIWMSGVSCSGDETALWQCPFYGDQDDDDDDDYDDDDDWRRRRLQSAWGSHDCDHDDDAGVICEQSSAPTATPSPAASPLVADNDSIREAVKLWLSDFVAAIRTYGHISTWETGGVTDMSRLFCDSSDYWSSCYNSGASSFNEDIGAWDTSGVTTMENMFYGAEAFNQPLSDWQVDKVMDMFAIFYDAESFDQDLGWCVGDDVDLYAAFRFSACESTSCGVYYSAALRCGGTPMTDASIRRAANEWVLNATAAEATYGHISTWETGGVTDMSDLFDGAGAFNEDIGAWNTSGVTTMYKMFYSASAFNRDIGGWAVDNVMSMEGMFASASSFNQDISGWAVDSLRDMYKMFYHAYRASAFDQDLGWCVADDVDLRRAFYNTQCESTSCGITKVRRESIVAG